MISTYINSYRCIHCIHLYNVYVCMYVCILVCMYIYACTSKRDGFWCFKRSIACILNQLMSRDGDSKRCMCTSAYVSLGQNMCILNQLMRHQEIPAADQSTQLLGQYLYFCSSKANKLGQLSVDEPRVSMRRTLDKRTYLKEKTSFTTAYSQS